MSVATAMFYFQNHKYSEVKEAFNKYYNLLKGHGCILQENFLSTIEKIQFLFDVGLQQYLFCFYTI